MDGGCLSSPRWVSLLVAEIYYPETITPINRRPPVHRSPVLSDDPPPVNDFHTYQQYLHKRAVPPSGESKSASVTKKSHCDGIDELGCFQVTRMQKWSGCGAEQQGTLVLVQNYGNYKYKNGLNIVASSRELLFRCRTTRVISKVTFHIF